MQGCLYRENGTVVERNWVIHQNLKSFIVTPWRCLHTQVGTSMYMLRPICDVNCFSPGEVLARPCYDVRQHRQTPSFRAMLPRTHQRAAQRQPQLQYIARVAHRL